MEAQWASNSFKSGKSHQWSAVLEMAFIYGQCKTKYSLINWSR